MKKISNREKLLLLVVLVLVAIYFFIDKMYTPITDEVKELRKQSEDLAIQVEDMNNKEELIADLSSQEETLQKEINEVNKDIFVVWDDPELLVYIERVFGEFGEVKSEAFSETLDATGYWTGDVTLSYETNYENLKKIMTEFEKNKYFNTVVTFDISSRSAEQANIDPNTGIITDTTLDTDNSDEVTNDDTLVVNLVLRFYSQETFGKYPDNYDFMKGIFGKENIFKE